MSKNDDYQKAYDDILQMQEEMHQKNVKRIRWGIRMVIFIPLIFMILMFVMGSAKTTYLVLWIVSMFLISGYIIFVEYYDYNLQVTLKRMGIKKTEIEQLLPENSLEARKQEIEKLINEKDNEDE